MQCNRLHTVNLGIDGLGDATEIGIGASAIVYRAAQQGLQRDVAIKVLVPSDHEFVRRFQREAVLLAKLSRSPHIVTVHDTGVTGSGQPYLVLQLCQGSLLDRIKRDGRIDPGEAAQIMAGVAAGVADAHRLQVVHRDLKPGNILVSDEGQYLVTDFGTSIVTGVTTIQTSSISFTAGYVAPETLMGSTSSYPVDVYALGATLFHMVSGSAPFLSSGESNIVALASRVVNDPIPDLRPIGVPDRLCRVIESAMAKDPVDRPTIGQLQAELEALSPAPRARVDEAPVSVFAGTGAAVGADGPSRPSVLGGEGPPLLADPDPTAGPPMVLADKRPAPASESPWWGVVSESLRRIRPRHALVAVSALLVMAVGVAAAAGFLGGKRGDTELASEPAAPILVDDGVLEIDAAEGEELGATSAAGAGASDLQVIDDLDPGRDEVNAAAVDRPAPDPESDPDPEPKPDPNAGTVIVPALTGLSEAEARAALSAAGLLGGVSSLAFSSTTEAGLVVSGSASGRVADGTTVDLVLSKGPAVTVPDLTNETAAAATEQLAVLSLTAAIETVEGTTTPPGSVVSMSPAPGTDVEEGSVVVLSVAAEILPTVPNVVGMTVEEATSALTAVGLALGPTTTIHDAAAAGLILGSTPTAGTEVAADASVAVTVSLGPEPNPCAGVVGQATDDAVAIVEAAGFTTQLTQGFSDVHPAGTIMACKKNTPPAKVVVLTVSEGALNPVPDIVGLKRPAALAALRTAGMTFTITNVFSSVPNNTVIATNPPAGSHYVEGTRVRVSISKGSDPDEAGE